MTLDVGDAAPDFELLDQDGVAVSLASLRGTSVLLYFYPRNGTPGCTTQACDIRDRMAEFTVAGVRVIGVSPDTVASHAAFRNDHGLPHTLLADPEHTVLEAYGAWGEKNMYGKVTVGVIRSSVLLDADGTIVKRWKRAQARQHAEHALKAIGHLMTEN